MSALSQGKNNSDSRTTKEKLSRLGYLVGAILLHLLVFLLIATFVVFQAIAPPAASTFQPVAIPNKPPPPPTPPSASGGETANALEPDLTVTPPPTSSAISTLNNASFTVAASPVKLPSLPSFTKPTGSGLTGTGASGSSSGAGSAFGSSSKNGDDQLEGYLYDLKQTPDRKPTGMTPDRYAQVLHNFVSRGWDESVLAGYYKFSHPLYATHILIPDMSADAGPQAFRADHEVQPMMWIVWYKLKRTPSSAGSFRLAGFADDVLLVRVNGDMVLDGSIYPVSDRPARKTPWPNAWIDNRVADQNYGALREGPVFRVDTAQEVSMDIIIGEQPGGSFNAALFLLKEGETYPKDSKGQPLLPLFQVAPTVSDPGGMHPPVSRTPEPW